MGLKFSSFFIGKKVSGGTLRDAKGTQRDTKGMLRDAKGRGSADEAALQKLKLRLTARIVVVSKRCATLQARCGGFKRLRLIRRPL